MITLEEFCAVLSDQFIDLDEQLSPTTRFREIASWDSLTAVAIYNEIKRLFPETSFVLADIPKCSVVEELYNAVCGRDSGTSSLQKESEFVFRFDRLVEALNLQSHVLKDKVALCEKVSEIADALLSNPFAADDDLCLFRVFDKGANIGGNINIPGQVTINGRNFKSLISSHTCVAEEARATGLGLELWDRCLDRAPSGLVTASSCSQMKIAVSRATGCTIFYSPRLIMLKKSRSVVEMKLRGIAGRMVSALIDCGLALYWAVIGLVSRLRTCGLAITTVDPTDSAALETIARIVESEKVSCGEVHDARWFKWMTTQSFSKDGPNKLLLISRGNTPVAFVMYKKRFHEQASHRGFKNVWLASIMEWGALPECRAKLSAILMRVASKIVKGCDAIEVIATEASVEKPLRRALWQHVGDGNFVFKVGKGSPLEAFPTMHERANWRLRPAMGDAGFN